MKVVCCVVIISALASAVGCGDESDTAPPSFPTTSPTTATASATGATLDAARRDKAGGARATGGLIDVPPTTRPAAP